VVPILRQLNPVHTLLGSLLKFNFNIIIESMSISSNRSFLQPFQPKTYMHLSPTRATCSAISSWLNRHNQVKVSVRVAARSKE